MVSKKSSLDLVCCCYVWTTEHRKPPKSLLPSVKTYPQAKLKTQVFQRHSWAHWTWYSGPSCYSQSNEHAQTHPDRHHLTGVCPSPSKDGDEQKFLEGEAIQVIASRLSSNSAATCPSFQSLILSLAANEGISVNVPDLSLSLSHQIWKLGLKCPGITGLFHWVSFENDASKAKVSGSHHSAVKWGEMSNPTDSLIELAQVLEVLKYDCRNWMGGGGSRGLNEPITPMCSEGQDYCQLFWERECKKNDFDCFKRRKWFNKQPMSPSILLLQ